MKIEIRKIKEEEIEEVEEKLQSGEEMYYVSSIYIPNCYLILWEQKAVGLCEFYRLEKEAVDVHYTLFPSYRGQRLAYPIWNKVKDIYGKTHPYIKKIYWLVAPENTKSLHIAQHDMTFDFDFYKVILKEGCYVHYPYFSINPYYKDKKKKRKKELTYPKRNDKIKA